MLIARLAGYLTGITLASLCGAVHAGIEGVPKLPPDAYHVEDYSVPGSETMQASFQVKSHYPSSHILDYYLSGVSSEWELCESKRAPGWETFIQNANGADKLVHQVIRYWVNRRQKKMLSVIVRHYSDGPGIRCRPDDDVQHGVVVVSMSPDLKKEIYLLHLSCANGVPSANVVASANGVPSADVVVSANGVPSANVVASANGLLSVASTAEEIPTPQCGAGE